MSGDDTKALSTAPDRTTCLSPVSAEPARSQVEAAAKCGERGEQLLDFGPDQRFISGLDTSQPLWFWSQRETPLYVATDTLILPSYIMYRKYLLR